MYVGRGGGRENPNYNQKNLQVEDVIPLKLLKKYI